MSIFDQIAEIGVVPVVAIDDPAHAVGLANALAKGGLPIAEITFRTEAARDSIFNISRECKNFIVGAGTVITQQQVTDAREAGASFALAPGTDPAIIAAAKAAGLPYAPGVSSASDLQIAIGQGCRFLKFFPAELAGGTKMLANIAAPFAHLGLGFNPTGGINTDNMKTWLADPLVKAVGGTWIATRQDIADQNWDLITEKAQAAVEIAKAIRENKRENKNV